VPLARAIGGRRAAAAKLRVGPSTRAALAAAGHRAATIGSTIHLPVAPDRSPGAVAVLAHELVHVAHPSKKARFHEDRRDSPEERAARRVERRVERRVQRWTSSVTPPVDARPRRGAADGLTFGTHRLPVGAMVTIAADASTPSPESASPATSPASPPTMSSTLPPETPAADSPPVPAAAGPLLGSSWGAAVPASGDVFAVGASTPDTGASVAPTVRPANVGQAASTVRQHDIDRLVRAVEQRVIDELERRGRLNRPVVF
jgi:hypothetical protein